MPASRTSIALTAILAVSSWTTSGYVNAGDAEPDDSGRVWDTVSGWVELLGPSADAPDEAWALPTPYDDNHKYLSQDGMLLTLIVEDGSTTVRRFDVGTGEEMWSVDLHEKVDPSLRVSPGAGILEIEGRLDSGDVDFTLLETENGRLIWEGEAFAPLVNASDELVMVEGQAIDIASGDVRWTYDGKVHVSDDVIVFERDADVTSEADRVFGVLEASTGDEMWSHPHALFSDIEVVGDVLIRTQDLDGNVDSATGHDVSTGAALWSTDLPSVGRADIAAISDELILLAPGGAPDPHAVVIDRTTGAIVWQAPVVDGARGFELDGRPYVVVDDGDRQVAYDGESGEELVDVEAEFSVPTPAGLVAKDGDEIVAVSLPGGDELWKITLPDDETFRYGMIDGGFVTIRDEYNDPSFVAYLS